MRHWGALMAALVCAGCGAPTPTGAIGDRAPLLSSVQSELGPPIVFNTQTRSELDVPACVSASKGHAQVKLHQDGAIEAVALSTTLVVRASGSGTSTT